ncbi:hypothetical protein [Cognatiluteimonas lumbrici]|uniref:hypothetical protein n=1 Tax=Cognatiluteimonas lumbrici TaxID=2559601 RepID=UPI00112827C8|nr:hypothetical protein [Luteimonas lumbrici]
MTRSATLAFRFAPTLWASLLHLALMAGAFVLFLGRKPGRFRSQAIIEAIPGFYTHVFNFSLSYLLYAGIGFLWLMMGVPMRFVAWAGAALVAANVGYELLLPLLNTRDPVDAAYGIAGTLLGFAWLWIVRRFGLTPIPAPAR